MAFDQREWVNEIALGVTVGLATGSVTALIALDAPAGITISIGGVLGLVPGVLNQPLKSLLNLIRSRFEKRRP
jgi:xanthosine utilization system XapX-like protein